MQWFIFFIASLPPDILSPRVAFSLSTSIIVPKSLRSALIAPVRLDFPEPFTPPIIVYIFMFSPPKKGTKKQPLFLCGYSSIVSL